MGLSRSRRMTPPQTWRKGPGELLSRSSSRVRCTTSSSRLARPSQNCERLNAQLISVGVLKLSGWTRTLSAKPWSGRWQPAQDTPGLASSQDRRKESFAQLPFGQVQRVAGRDVFAGSGKPSGTLILTDRRRADGHGPSGQRRQADDGGRLRRTVTGAFQNAGSLAHSSGCTLGVDEVDQHGRFGWTIPASCRASGRSSCWPAGPRRFTAAPQRCSSTSSPSGCWGCPATPNRDPDPRPADPATPRPATRDIALRVVIGGESQPHCNRAEGHAHER